MTVHRIGPGRWETRLRFGGGQRERFIIHASTRPEAEAREARLVQLARTLARIDGADARGVLETAAAASESELARVEATVKGTLDAARERGPAAAPPARTFADVAELLFAEQLRRGNSPRTVAKDRQRVRVLAAKLGRVPVDQVTSKLADEAMVLVPESVRASRPLYESLIARVLKHALRLELIRALPLRPDFVSKLHAPEKIFQYLPAEDEFRLVAGPAPIWRRIGYGMMSRESVRPEFLSLFYYADRAPADAVVSTIDLESGLLTHRHKQKRVRRWPVCERVLRVLRAWRELHPDTARVLPSWDHHNISRTLRGDLIAAGVTRAALHRTTATERQIAAKDAGRATFVTLALRAGAPMHWVTDRTGHMTQQMIDRYNRMARESRDTARAWLCPLDEALGGALGLEPLTTPFVVPWLQGLPVAPRPIVGDDLGHRLGELLELVKQNAMITRTGADRTDSRHEPLVTPEQPKKASSSVSSGSGGTSCPGQTAGVGQESPVELELAKALRAATDAGQWALVAELARELGERRRERTAPDVTSLDAARAKRNGGAS